MTYFCFGSQSLQINKNFRCPKLLSISKFTVFLYRKSKKGRKKIVLYPADNIYEMITNHVVPKWQQYLSFKSAKADNSKIIQPRGDTIWKKILRDVREFYRILFRVRFHYLDFKDRKGALKCTEILFEELGIPLEEEYKEDMKLFTYLHQSHRLTNQKLVKNEDSFNGVSPFEVIEKFNDSSRKTFMSDTVGSRLFYFVFSNFLENYCPFINKKYAKRVVTLICLLLRCYRKMEDNSHLKRIYFLLN